jgi:hypothetical protein
VNQGSRPFRAGESIEDACRVCKTDRLHTVIAVDEHGTPLRVSCGYCGSDHNFRGGGRIGIVGERDRSAGEPARRPTDPGKPPFPIVSDRERTTEAMVTTAGAGMDLELLLRRVIREECGVTPVVPADKWRGGTLVLRPGTPGLQEKSIPIETFFHKVVMLRNRLRTLEQQINASDLAEDVKIRLQSYISGCYGTLTTFNVLFADDADQFKGNATD